MTTDQTENLAILAAELAARPNVAPRVRPDVAGRDAVKLHNIGRQLHRLAEQDCNVGLDPRGEARWRKLEAQAAKIAEPYGLTVRTAGDPRGYVLRLIGLPGNTWGGDSEGYGVG